MPEPQHIGKGSVLQLRADDPDSLFTVTRAHVTWNQTNHITGKQMLIIEVEVERDIPHQGGEKGEGAGA